MDNPQYIVLAALDTPSLDCGTYLSGGAMAAPTVGAILKDLLPYLNVPREEGADQEVNIMNYVGLDLKTAEKTAGSQGLILKTAGEGNWVVRQIPTPGQSALAGSELLIYLGTEPAPEKK